MSPLTQFDGAATREGFITFHDQVERLFREARDDVYYYILSFGLEAHEAQEIAQDVFLRFYVALKRGDSIDQPRGWIFRVAHNLAVNAVRRAARWRVFAFEPWNWGVASGDNPEETLIRKEAAGRIRQALAGLSPQQRLCLQLRADGLRYAEIARTIGIGTSTVGEFLSRAIKKLRRAVHE